MIPVILATGFIGLILLVLGFKLDEKHQVLKVLTIFFTVFIILYLGRLTLDSNEVCYRELNETIEVYIYGNNFTSTLDNAEHWTPTSDPTPTTNQLTNIGNLVLLHRNTYPNYNTVCYNTTTSTTPRSIYQTTLWYFRVVFVYVFGFLIWLVGTYLLHVNNMRKTP